jgi:outer membrane autotransporter protein
VTATITGGYLPTLLGPLSYSLPAVDVSRDWASVTLGTEIKFGPNMAAVVSGTGAFGQDDVEKYGVQAGLRIKF